MAQFPQFIRLPLELRRQVWHLTISQPRVHGVQVDLDNGTLSAADSLASSTSPLRTLLATCRESRHEALRSHPKQLSFTNREDHAPGVLYFNPAIDVICIVHGGKEVFLKVADLEFARLQGDVEAEKALEWTADIQKLALQAMDSNFQDDWWLDIAGMVKPTRQKCNPELEFVAAFLHLREIYLVAVPTPADPDSMEIGTPLHSGGSDDVSDEDSGGDEENNQTHQIVRKAHGKGRLRGPWLRGREDVEDWFCWVTSLCSWDYGDDDSHDQESLFHELLDWQESFSDNLQYPSPKSNLSEEAKKRMKRVKCRPMVHFEEGCEMPEYED